MDQPSQPNRLTSFFEDDEISSPAQIPSKIKANSDLDEDDDETDDYEKSKLDNEYPEKEDDDEEENEEIALIKEKIEVARDEMSGLIDGRVIFMRDKENPERIYMLARFDDILPDEINKLGKEMWIADIILRLKGRGYSNPDQTIKPIHPEIFKKKNWNSRTE